jgi:hypothetical protein
VLDGLKATADHGGPPGMRKARLLLKVLRDRILPEWLRATASDQSPENKRLIRVIASRSPLALPAFIR